MRNLNRYIPDTATADLAPFKNYVANGANCKPCTNGCLSCDVDANCK